MIAESKARSHAQAFRWWPGDPALIADEAARRDFVALRGRTSSTASADLTPPGGPDLAPAAGGLPADVSAPKSFGSSICSYGRGKGLSIAAPSNNMPGQKPVPSSLRCVATRDHLRTHWGVNRGSFRRRSLDAYATAALVRGGRRG